PAVCAGVDPRPARYIAVLSVVAGAEVNGMVILHPHAFGAGIRRANVVRERVARYTPCEVAASSIGGDGKRVGLIGIQVSKGDIGPPVSGTSRNVVLNIPDQIDSVVKRRVGVGVTICRPAAGGARQSPRRCELSGHACRLAGSEIEQIALGSTCATIERDAGRIVDSV